MKTILAAILAALSLGTAQAVEYVTLTPTNPEKTVLATDVVEVAAAFPVGINYRSSNVTMELTFADGTVTSSSIGADLTNSAGYYRRNNAIIGQKFTGLTQIRVKESPIKPVITLKITSASEINAVTPSAVLVLPENSTGSYDVVIEASDDLVNWLPFFSQTVNSQTAKKFFRTRVVRSEAPVQKP